jgi:hypothetical protein
MHTKMGDSHRINGTKKRPHVLNTGLSAHLKKVKHTNNSYTHIKNIILAL